MKLDPCSSGGRVFLLGQIKVMCLRWFRERVQYEYYRFTDLDLKKGSLAYADILVSNNAINGISDPHLVLSRAVDLEYNLSQLEGTWVRRAA